ncbi:hypothetical protein A2803_02235 [Candidatus Woesebacteria bacterium RIFCSPHIGHO2_01_FULL_44_21]|uniref:RNA polymerase sigma-70 region 4 domain-containing protein n=1 Tax=Candidatus Woesebacteria bacterium RIFCSPHIGHO2_01_FULL_44_21 TaxID=1802503 RepID=A0A1F7YW14_9BACT|nr:MAG: hypothetical protein A2803_02235 [Candidatus Woesebacteria bacterium RIFCSPHIGHO2_01_FULL_44_21]
MRSNKTLEYFSWYIKKFSDLNSRERVVLLSRLAESTHVAIGNKWNVTEGRVRQIEKAAIGKIKSKTHQLALFKFKN